MRVNPHLRDDHILGQVFELELWFQNSVVRTAVGVDDKVLRESEALLEVGEEDASVVHSPEDLRHEHEEHEEEHELPEADEEIKLWNCSEF